MKKIAVIGQGYVGLASSIGLSKHFTEFVFEWRNVIDYKMLNVLRF